MARPLSSMLMNFTISQSELDGVASDNYRWNDWAPVVFDWCHDVMTSNAAVYLHGEVQQLHDDHDREGVGRSWHGGQ